MRTFSLFALLFVGLSACHPETVAGPELVLTLDSTVECDPATDPDCPPPCDPDVDPECDPYGGHMGGGN